MKGKTKKDWIILIWYLGIFALFCVTRLWKLDEIPGGIHIDEAGMAYDAWSLAEYGVDRYLKSWPVYLTNFGGGQSSLYAFFAALLFRFFGYHVVIMRLPSVIFSFLNLFFGIKIAKKLFGDNSYMPCVFGTIATIAPCFIMLARIGMDCNLMLGMSTVFLYLLICAMDNGKWQYYCLAGVTGGLVLYTYALSYIAVPVFLILSFLYVVRVKKFSFKNWLIMAVPMGILAMPLILVQLVNLFDLPEMHMGIFTITKLGDYRVSELGMPTWSNFFNTLSYLFKGDTLIYNSIPKFAVLYKITNVLFIAGFLRIVYLLFRSIRNKEFGKETFVFLWFLAVALLGVLTETNVNKLNAIYCVEVLIAMYGLQWICDRRGIIGKSLKIGVAVCYVLCFWSFASYYYGGDYMAENKPLAYFSATVEEAVRDISGNPKINGKVTQMAQDKIYLALSLQLSPYDYQSEEGMELFRCSYLGAIEEQYNYIVENKYAEYMQQLRDMGFAEINYGEYALFYKE